MSCSAVTQQRVKQSHTKYLREGWDQISEVTEYRALTPKEYRNQLLIRVSMRTKFLFTQETGGEDSATVTINFHALPSP